jgi:hypothetical protein
MATDTQSEYVILIAFHGNDGYANAPYCYVIHTLPLLRDMKLPLRLLAARLAFSTRVRQMTDSADTTY